MTMSGTCSCGRFLWFDTIETELENAKNNAEYKRYLELTRPNGIFSCPNCKKQYNEHDFKNLKDCRGYGEHSGYSSDPHVAYQQAIASGFENRYRAEKRAYTNTKPTIPLDIILLGCCVGGASLLWKYFTSIVRNPYDMFMVAVWDLLFIACLFGAVVFLIILVGDISTWFEEKRNKLCKYMR